MTYNIIYFKLSSSVLFGLVLVTHWVSPKLQPSINIFFLLSLSKLANFS